MNKKWLVLFAVFITGITRADTPYPSVRYSCLDTEDKITIDHETTWPDNVDSLYKTEKIERTCRLSSGEFRVVMNYFPETNKGGSFMAVVLTIHSGDTTILENTYFGTGVDDDNSVKQIIVHGSGSRVELIRLGDIYKLHKAIRLLDIVAVQAQLKLGANPNETDYTGNSTLVLAVERKNFAISELLLKNGADPNLGFWAAANEGAVDIAKLLMKYKADVNGGINPNSRGSPLMFASYKGDLQMVKLLVTSGADVNAFGAHWTNIPAINAAARNGHVRVVEFLVSSGANVNIADHHGFTPLITAARSGISAPYVEIVRLLLQAGASASAKDKSGMTALSHALQNGKDANMALVKLLEDAR